MTDQRKPGIDHTGDSTENKVKHHRIATDIPEKLSAEERAAWRSAWRSLHAASSDDTAAAAESCDKK